MEQGAEDARQPLSQTRQVTIDALCEHFANDVMGVEEFERRIAARKCCWTTGKN